MKSAYQLEVNFFFCDRHGAVFVFLINAPSQPLARSPAIQGKISKLTPVKK